MRKTPVVLAIVAWVGFHAAYQLGTVKHHMVRVEAKERISRGTGDSLSHKYVVFTDVGVFQNTDSLFHLKWSSSDLQNRLKVGGEYEIRTYGWRIPFLSTYENIVEVSERKRPTSER